jgi:hypothetical protein
VIGAQPHLTAARGRLDEDSGQVGGSECGSETAPGWLCVSNMASLEVSWERVVVEVLTV